MHDRFYFATCQVGAEKALKDEVLLASPSLHFAFSRPGFVTFKESREAPSAPFEFRGVFARLWGEVLGQAKDRAALEALAALIPPGSIVQRFDRDQHEPGEEPPSFTRNARAREACEGILGIDKDGVPSPGCLVYSLVWVDDFHLFLTRHTHAEWMSGSPGNIPDIALPDHAPSRAYLKIEEAFLRFKPAIRPGICALEVGCAPGGASTAMLDRGLVVRGIDPQAMDERVTAREGFKLIRKLARYSTEEDLRGFNPEWLVMDMGIKPREALDELSHVMSVLRRLYGSSLRLRCGFLTIKLGQWKFASEIPEYLTRLEKLGFKDLLPLQLFANRQEFFVWAPRFE